MTCIYEVDSGSRSFQFIPSTESSSATPPASTMGSTIVLSPERLRNLEERLENLTGMVQSLQKDRPSAVEIASVKSEGPASQSRKRTRHASPEGTNNGDGEHLDVQAPGRTRYASKSFWASLCNEVSEVEFLLRSQARFEGPMLEGPKRRKGSLTGLLLSPPPGPTPRKLSDLQERGEDGLNELPPRASCDELLEAYIWNYHPIVPLVHVPSFRLEYERFWELGARHRALNQRTPLVLAILFGGAVVCSNKVFERLFPHQDREDLTHQLHWVCSEALRKSRFPRVPTIETLTAYMILQG